MPPVWFYDLMYRWRAPWEMGARSELIALVQSGRVTPERLAPGRAVDLGCGAGANAVFLAQAGFDSDVSGRARGHWLANAPRTVHDGRVC